MTYELLCAGFGGQGVMLMGQLLAYAATMEGKETTFFQSYGPEMRGGTANCQVVISDTPISSPVLSSPQAVIVMNRPSFEKYEPLVHSGGILFVNSSLIDLVSQRADIETHYIPASQIAQEVGNTLVANVVMTGAYVERLHPIASESIEAVLVKTLTGRKERYLTLNLEAFKRGAAIITKTKEQTA